MIRQDRQKKMMELQHLINQEIGNDNQQKVKHYYFDGRTMNSNPVISNSPSPNLYQSTSWHSPIPIQEMEQEMSRQEGAPLECLCLLGEHPLCAATMGIAK